MRSDLKTLIVLWPPLLGHFILLIPSGAAFVVKDNVQNVSSVIPDKPGVIGSDVIDKSTKTSQLKEGSESLLSGIERSHIEELKEEIEGEGKKVPKMNGQGNESLETKIVEKKRELEALNQEKLNLEKKVVESKTTEEEKDITLIDPVGKEESPIVSELKTETKNTGETERKEENSQEISLWQQVWQSLFSSGQNVKTEENSIEKPKNQEKVLKEGNVEKEKTNGNELGKDLKKSKGNGQVIEKLKPEESKKDEDEKQHKVTKNKSPTDPQKLTDQVKLTGEDKKILKGGEKQKGTSKTDETTKNNEKDKKNINETEKVKTKDSEIIEEKGNLKKPEKEEEKLKVSEKIVDKTIRHDETKHKLEDLAKKVVTVKKEKVENQNNINKDVVQKPAFVKPASQKNGEGKKHKTKSGKKEKKSPGQANHSDESSYESEESVELTKGKGNFAEHVQN
ncbi:unnamed protein product [Meloidogyne enterolobii]|uniref:Uncharacterized protein n=1 Tax=Meloidogyne enterolobii TaxID=390850 RepID=A0ACB0YCS9_MELEN